MINNEFSNEIIKLDFYKEYFINTITNLLKSKNLISEFSYKIDEDIFIKVRDIKTKQLYHIDFYYDDNDDNNNFYLVSTTFPYFDEEEFKINVKTIILSLLMNTNDFEQILTKHLTN